MESKVTLTVLFGFISLIDGTGLYDGCCPVGFVRRNNECVCAADAPTLHVLSCDNTTALIKSGYWIGYVDAEDSTEETACGKVLYAGRCPDGLCVDKEEEGVRLHRNSSKEEVENILCGSTRTGILCGDCQTEYGPGINFYLAPCVNCSEEAFSQYGELLWLGLEVLPLTIMLLTFLVFDVNLLTGPFNSYLLYAQFFSASFAIRSEGLISIEDDALSYILRGIYILFFGIFNLQFFSFLFPPFCLSSKGDRLDVLDIVVIKALTRVYPFLIILLFIITQTCIKRNGCCFRLWKFTNYCRKWKICNSRSSCIHGLATFYILTYPRFLTYCGVLFSQIVLRSPQAPDLSVVKIKGTVIFFQDLKHILYCILLLVILVVLIVPPTVLLIVYPAVSILKGKLLNCRYKSIQKITGFKIFDIFSKPWIRHTADLFQGCYKHNYKFFAAFLLLARIAMVMALSLTSTKEDGYLALAIISLFVLMVQSWCQPNETPWINNIDTFIYTHLVVVNVVALYSLDVSLANGVSQALITLLLLPAVYLVAYISNKARKVAVKSYKTWRLKDRKANSRMQTLGDSLLQEEGIEPRHQHLLSVAPSYLDTWSTESEA